MTHRESHLHKYFYQKPDEPTKFNYKCSWCGAEVEAGIDRCPRCNFPYKVETHTNNIELEMATKLDTGFSNDEILIQILRNQMKIMDYIGYKYRETYGEKAICKRLLDDDITRTEYMALFLDERCHGRRV